MGDCKVSEKTEDLISEIIKVILVFSFFGVSFYLAIEGSDGWGWFLFVGILFTSAKTGRSARLAKSAKTEEDHF
jgi:hypothetical protein